MARAREMAQQVKPCCVSQAPMRGAHGKVGGGADSSVPCLPPCALPCPHPHNNK